MASIPLAIVVVAALVVPLAVIPGSFGFHAWPTSSAERITEHSIHETPRRIKVVEDGPARAATAKYTSVATRTSASKPAASHAVATTSTPAHRESARLVTTTTPGHRSSGHHGGSGRGPGHGSPAPSTHATPSSPSVPASEPEPAAGGQTGSGQVASGDAPVLRNDHPATPVAPPSPVVPVAPAPAATAPAEDGDRGCNGHGNRGHGHGVVGSIVHGVGRHLGHGHDGD